MEKHFLLLILPILLAACTDPLKEENAVLQKSVMDVHDEAMAKMGTMQELEVQLKEQIKADSTDSAFHEMAQVKITQLAEAHEAMMNWMRAYQPPTEEQDAKQVKAYLTDQKAKIEEVQVMTNKSIEEAEALLGDR